MTVQAPPPTVDRMRRCFVHIGTPKTGSTSLQIFLADNRERLGACGLFIPRTAGTHDAASTGHHAVVSDLLGQAPVETGGFDTVMAELRSSAAPQACLSSENFSLLYDRPELLARLRDAIVSAGFEPVIVVFLRPQVSYATAIFALNVLDGYRRSFSAYLNELIDRGTYVWSAGFGPQFDYVALLDGFAAVFGRTAIRIQRFSSDAPDRDLMRRFVGIMLPDAPFAQFAMPARRANRTLTFAAVLRLLERPNDFDQHLRFAPIGLRDVVRLWLRFAPTNRRLAARYGFRLPTLEVLDVVRAIPIRRTMSRTRQLWQARRMVRSSIYGAIDASSRSSVSHGL